MIRVGVQLAPLPQLVKIIAEVRCLSWHGTSFSFTSLPDAASKSRGLIIPRKSLRNLQRFPALVARAPRDAERITTGWPWSLCG